MVRSHDRAGATTLRADLGVVEITEPMPMSAAVSIFAPWMITP